MIVSIMKKMGKNRMEQTMLPIIMRARMMSMGVGIATANPHIEKSNEMERVIAT